MAQDNDKPNNGETLEGEWRETANADSSDDNNPDVDITLPQIDKTPKRRGFAAIVGILLLLLVLAALGGAGYFGWQASKDVLDGQAQTRSDQAQLILQIQTLEASLKELQEQQYQSRKSSAESTQQLATDISQVGDVQREQADSITALQNPMAAWVARCGNQQTGWQLAEAEWLIWLANMRLQLQEQYAGATSALEQADQLLQQVNHPRLRRVRAQLAEEMLALKTTERPDIDNIALSLLAMSNQANELPLPARPKPTGEIQEADASQAKPEGWQGALAGLWQEIRGLVVIRRQEKNLRPWLSEREEQLIYQGLQVRLDAARLAALRGKGTLFQQSVRSAQTWLLTWFDTHTAAVEAADSELSALAKQHLDHNPPDISKSLTMLRQLRQQGLR
ncbi:MAG: uroporphyrinogen-III C-methyltransferase [Gammaproteobacteria bacterium]|nr:uroporphyrinogen-III C-methyltransferase [Gammaproteobacteria bacterium]